MEIERILREYIYTLAGSEDSVEVIKSAFSDVAEKYRIGEFRSSFFVEPTFSTRSGENRSDVLFKAEGEIDESLEYSVTYETGERGVATFSIYRFCGENEFTEEEKQVLKAFFDVLFVHFGRYRMINAVKRMAATDSLTGIWNPMGFMAYLENVLKRKQLQKYSAFYFNLARFNLVNKRFGTRETDLIIIRYVECLKNFLKEGECVGRLGGDNFVALIEKERTFEFLELIGGVETYGMLREGKIPIVISAVAGVLDIDDSIEDYGTVMAACGMAMNVARHIEKKPYVFSSPKIKETIYKEQQYVTGFEDAVRKKEFKAYYQPKVSADDYTIVGAEALVRWEHNGRLIAPREFVHIFERNSMICELDFYMLESVCQDIREWLEKGIEPVRVSVNLSRKHLANKNLSEDIMQILHRYDMESRYIEIELTETVDEQEVQLLVSFMNKMKENNVAVSIDDFGTGYSSLNLLRSFPVDVLKVDKSFIYSFEKCDRIVLSNIIRMARELDMDVVAEGVETKQQLEYLKEMNCTVVQGYLFDKPMEKADFEKRMIIGKYDEDEIECS